MDYHQPIFRRKLMIISILWLVTLSSCQIFGRNNLDLLDSVPTGSASQLQDTGTLVPQKVNTNTPESTETATLPVVTPTLPLVQSTKERLPTPQNESLISALQKKALGYNLNRDTFDLWESSARPGDLAKVGPQGYSYAEKLTKGYIALQYPPDGSKSTGPSNLLLSKAQGITLFESLEPNQIFAEAEQINKDGKQLVVAPTGARLLRWEESTIKEIAKLSDVFIIQAQRWLIEDKSPRKQNFVGNVVMFSQIIREANPNCKIFVEVGRRADRGGGTAEEWIEAIGYLYAADPNSFDGIYLFITLQASSPNEGFGALNDMVKLLRP